MEINAKKSFSKEFQYDLLTLYEMCYENNTDSCTVTFDYPNSYLSIDFTFRGGVK